MLITKVELKNYRIHEELSITFERGINLLIGQNGVGKSSVLEALGFALFDSELRSRGRSDRAVKHGAKTAQIFVWFIGNDGNEYRVERRIGASSRWQLFFGGEQSPRYQSKDQVLPMIRTLSGIHQNEDLVFTNVICAVQNRFTEMFNLTAQNREDTFNRLFDTDIYRRMYKSFADGEDSVTAKYRERENRLIGEIGSRETQQLDTVTASADLEKVLCEQRECERLSLEAVELLKISELLLQQSIESFQRFRAMDQERLHAGRESETHRAMLAESNELLTRAQQSLVVVESCRSGFELYEQLHARVQQLEKSIESELELRRQSDFVKQNIAEKKVLAEKLQGARSTLSARIESAKKSAESRFAEAEAVLKSASEKSAELEAVVNQGKLAKQISERYSAHLEEFRHSAEKIMQFTLQLAELEKTAAEKAQLLTDQIDCTEQLEKLYLHEKELKKIKEQRHSVEIERSALEKAQADLGTGLCPILCEPCENIKRSESGTGYFETRKSELLKMIEELSVLESNYSDIPGIIKEKEHQKAQIQLRLTQCSEAFVRIETIRSRMALEDQKCALSLQKCSLTEPENHHKDLPYSYFEERCTYVKNERIRLLSVHSELKKNVLELKNREAELRSEAEAAVQSAAECEHELIRISGEIAQLTAEIPAAEENLLEISKSLEQFASVRAEITVLRAEMQSCEPAWKSVIEHREQACKIDEYRTAAEQHAVKAAELELQRDRLAGLLELFSEEASFIQIKSYEDTVKSARERAEQLAQSAVLLSEKIKNLQAAVQKAEIERVLLVSLKKELASVQRKSELTELFRRNINEMGRFVVAGVVESTAREASEHFRRITGRAEWIDWIVDDQEKYAVYLSLDDGDKHFRREFSVLSGGEQVAVSLSLRAALARELSSADFTIFDEPTINLDSDRKTALAESLKGIIGTIGQTIIVTHDDLFREMAQNIVELS